METETEENLSSGGQHKRNPRATKAKLTERQSATLAILSEGPLDVYQISAKLSLSIPQTMTVVQRLLKANRIKKYGREGNRMTYGINTTNPISKSNELQTVWKSPLPTLALPVQIGETLEVVSVIISNKGIQLNVVDANSSKKTLLLQD